MSVVYLKLYLEFSILCRIKYSANSR